MCVIPFLLVFVPGTKWAFQQKLNGSVFILTSANWTVHHNYYVTSVYAFLFRLFFRMARVLCMLLSQFTFSPNEWIRIEGRLDSCSRFFNDFLALGAANVTIFGNNIQVNLEMVRYKHFDSQTKEAARVECPFSRVNTVWLHFIDMKNKRILFSFWFSIIQLWNNEMVWRLLFISLVYMESLDLFLSLITVNSFNFVLP